MAKAQAKAAACRATQSLDFPLLCRHSCIVSCDTGGKKMKFLHTMLRVKDLKSALDFFVNKLGLVETRRMENEAGRFTLVYLATAPGEPEVELTHNWDNQDDYPVGRFFGHIAFQVDDIYATCETLMRAGVLIHRPPRDGRMAFIKSPDGHSVELLQKGAALPAKAPWTEMPNVGTW